MKNDILFSLCSEDFQTVAIQEIDRLLTEDEMVKVRKLVDEKINWYDAIVNSINELLNSKISET